MPVLTSSNVIGDERTPVLYILMRNDMESMNPGKAMAQASHASNAFVHEFETVKDEFKRYMFEVWRNETSQGFGTVLVLAVDEFAMRLTVENAKRAGFIANIIHDPTYPLRDGATTHFIPVDTCAYVFVEDKDDKLAKALLGGFPLHP